MPGLSRKIPSPLLLLALIIVALMSISASAQAPSSAAGEAAITIPQLIAIIILIIVAVYTFLGANVLGLTEPLLVGSIAGFILGIPATGIVLSALVELVYLGVFPIGGAAAPNAMIASIVSVMVAKILGYTTISTEVLTSLVAVVAVPVALLTAALEIALARAGCTIYAHQVDRSIDEGKIGRISLIVPLGTLNWVIAYMIPVLAFASLGLTPQAADAIRSALNTPTAQTIIRGFSVAGALLPALGLGYLMKLLFRREYIPWFILGFVLTAYLKLPILGVTLLVVGLLLVIYWREVESVFRASSNPGSEPAARPSEKREALLSRSDLNTAFLKTIFADQWSWNYERMQGQSYAFIMKHIEEKLRKDPEELKSWMRLHNEFFNTNPVMTPAIVGLNIALEERGADQDTIRALKTSLMGPFAGLGDGLIWFTWRPIAFGLGASIAIATASGLGPLVSFILWVPVIVLIAYYLMMYGYTQGERLMSIIGAGGLRVIRDVAAALAIAIVASLGVTYINVYTPLQITLPGGATPISIQSAIDQILPRLIPLVFLLVAYWLYRRGWGITRVLALYFVIGFILGIAGVLAVP